jgi:hypothetical protein
MMQEVAPAQTSVRRTAPQSHLVDVVVFRRTRDRQSVNRSATAWLATIVGAALTLVLISPGLKHLGQDIGVRDGQLS